MTHFINTIVINNISNMELKEYITESLVQITEGINEAMKRLEGTGVIINPNSTFHTDGHFWIGKHQKSGPVERWVQMVEMNITTTVTDATEGQGGAKINVGILNIGGGVKDTGSEQNTNSIKFTIPVCFPSTDVLKK